MNTRTLTRRLYEDFSSLVEATGHCPSGKVVYRSPAKAKKQVKRLHSMGRGETNFYRCRVLLDGEPHWHLTSRRDWV